jgi:hypothetical protein
MNCQWCIEIFVEINLLLGGATRALNLIGRSVSGR